MFSWQNNIFDSLIREINWDTHIIILKGNSGIGKTFIAKEVEKYYNNNFEFNKKKCMYFTGNDIYKFTDYYIFREHFNKELLENTVTPSQISQSVIREGFKGIPAIGDLLSWASELVINKYSKHTNSLLDSQSNEIMIVLENILRKRESLLIFDDINALDSSSINLLKYFLSRKLDDDFKFLHKATLLLVINDEYDDEFTKWLNNCNFNFEYKEFEVPTPKLRDINSILEELNYEYLHNIDSKSIEFIYDISGGNIELIKQLVFVLNENNNNLKSIFDTNIKNEGKQSFNNILESRLKLMGADGIYIDELLSTASLIGINFTLNELEYVTEIKRDKIKEVIKNSNDAKLTESIADASYKFTHSIIRLIFRYRINDDKAEYYKKIEKYLQIIRPDEYFLRADYLFEAGDYNYSAQIYLLGYFKHLRDNITISENIKSRIEYLICDNYILNEYYANMNSAYNLYAQHRFYDCINKLRRINDVINPILSMEKDYLIAIASKKVYSNDTGLNYSKERLLCIYEATNLEESELWARCASCLMALYYDCFHDDRKAFEINRKLGYYYGTRRDYDPNAEYNINILNRKSKIFNSSEFAAEDTKISVEFFKKTSYLSQYHKSLCNHIGNLITQGKYIDAFDYIKDDIGILNEYKNLMGYNRYYIINNIILCGVYSKNISIKSGIDIYKKMLKNNLESDDAFILNNNLSVLRVFEGNLEKAKKQFETMILDQRIKNDDYYDYFISMNLASVLYLSNEKIKAIDILNNYEGRIPFICKNEEEYLKKRHYYLKELFNSDEVVCLNNFDTYLVKKYPSTIGESWNHWGRGFLTSDLQFWSES